MENQCHIKTKLETRHFAPDLQELVDTILTSVMALASRVNSLGGILIHPLEGVQ